MTSLTQWIAAIRKRLNPGVFPIEVEQQLAAVVGEAVRLRPTLRSGGGFGRVLNIHAANDRRRIFGCVRWIDPDATIASAPTVTEPFLPRILLPSTQRLQREARAMTQLGDCGLSPQLLLHGDNFVATRYLPWARASTILKADERTIWQLLPTMLSAVRQMHACGEVHCDLNCGNLLVHPSGTKVAFIDFEYSPRPDLTVEAQQAFDYVRLLHGILKPRRGKGEILKDLRRFTEMLRIGLPRIPVGTQLACLPDECFERIDCHLPMAALLKDYFGVQRRGARRERSLVKS